LTPEFQNKINSEVEKFCSELPASPAELYEPIRYMLGLGGKRIRPLFVLMACHLYSDDPEKALPAALATELFHNFTLIHDDIMDNAPLRRNKPTVHSKWNSSTAILSGDVMMVKAYELIARSKVSGNTLQATLEAFNKMAVGVCEGQQLDLNFETLHSISIPQYYRMIELKTAVLLGACLQIGAQIGEAAGADAQNLFEFGKNTGLAFQLQDDLLDVYGEKEKFGKLKGGDILANKKTFLLLKARDIATSNHYLKEELDQWMGIKTTGEKDAAEKIKAVTRIYDFVNIRKITEQEINSYHQKAIEALSRVGGNMSRKQGLLDLTGKLLSRES
jgi:geranylgeranyl diphosphate synthase type II